MKKKIWQRIVAVLSALLTIIIVAGVVMSSKIEAEAADTFLGIQNLITEVSNDYAQTQNKYTILEIVPDRSASEIGYLFDGYEPAISSWDSTDMRWKGWKEQLEECADEDERIELIDGDGTEGSGLKARLQAYYTTQGITNGPVSVVDNEYENPFTNNYWFHKYVLGMSSGEYANFPVEVISYTPTELKSAYENDTFPDFDFLYINSGKSTDNKSTSEYEGWVYSSGYDATTKKGADISFEVGELLFATVQNNLLPCIVDGNIIFTQNQADSDDVSRNTDVANDAPEIYKLCMALCQSSLDDVNYSTIRTDASTDEEKETLWTNFWNGLAEGMDNGHFTTDHVYCHTGDVSIIRDGFGTEYFYSAGSLIPKGFSKVLDEIELENLYRKSDSSGAYKALSTDISYATAIRHVVNYQNRRNVQTKSHINVLEIQPAKTKDGKPELTVEQIRKWAPDVQTADITVMTTAEFIGKVETLNDKYDLIYIGTNKYHMNTTGEGGTGTTVFNDSAMNGLIYYHTGDKRYVAMELTGQLNTEYLNNDRNNNPYFYVPTRYGGNDITKEKMNALLSYLDGSYPVILSDEFFDSPVIVYEGNFGGRSAVFYEGEYDVNGLIANGMRSNQASSIKIREGYRVHLYDGDYFTGEYKVFDYTFKQASYDYGEIQSLRKAGFTNDRLSSLIVEPVDGSPGRKVINKTHIDNSSYMYEFATTAASRKYTNFYQFSDIEDNSELFKYYLNRPKVNMTNFSANGTKLEGQNTYCITPGLDGLYNMEFRFTIQNEGAASINTQYQCKLYVDVNSDGKYSSQEMLEDTVITSGGASVASNQLYGGKEYVLKRIVPDGYKGVFPWRVEISQVNNSNIYCCKEGYTKLEGLETETVNIIQIGRDHILYPNPDYWDYETEKFFSLAEQINGKKTIYEIGEPQTVDGETYVLESSAYSSDTEKVEGYENNLYYILVHGGTFAGEYYEGIDDEFDINVDFYTISKFEEEFNDGNIDMSKYNMLILGFADAYGEFSGDANDASTCLGSIVSFINSGKSVLMSHDNMSYFNYEKGKQGIVDRNNPLTSLATDGQYHHAYSMNQTIRGLVGMDRYGILEPGITGILKSGTALTYGTTEYNTVAGSGKDMAYTPKSGRSTTVPEVHGYTYSIINAKDKDSRVEDGEDPKVYTSAETGLTSGWTNNFLNIRYGTVYYNNGDIASWVGEYDNGEIPGNYDAAVHNLLVKQVNQGQITEYPYKLKDTFQVSTTHGQYYQLDFNADDDKDGQSDMVVWYCLGQRVNSSGQLQETIYSMSPNDVANNYYIYTKGNITYTGMGHAGMESAYMVEEAKLFINTMITAYSAGVKSPILTVRENANADAPQMNVMYRYFENDEFPLDTGTSGSNTHEKVYFTIQDVNFIKGSRRMTVKAFYRSATGDQSIVYKNENVSVTQLDSSGLVYDAYTNQSVDAENLQSGGFYYVKVPADVLQECAQTESEIFIETQSIITTNNDVVETEKVYARLDIMKVYLFELE